MFRLTWTIHGRSHKLMHRLAGSSACRMRIRSGGHAALVWSAHASYGRGDPYGLRHRHGARAVAKVTAIQTQGRRILLIFSGTIAGHSAAGAVILVAALITGSVVAQTRPPDQPEIRQLVAEAVDAASADLGILVDPTVSEEIAKTVMVFASNFCYPPDLGPSVARCERTVRRSSVLTSEVRSYLKSALDERPSALRSVGAALAEREGMFFEHIGWSSELPNRVAVVQLPRTPSGTVSLRTASGPLRLGSNRQHLLVAPGTLEIEVVEGSSKSIAMVQAQAGRVVVAALDGQRDGGSGPPLRIDPPVALYCGGLEARSSDALRFFNWGRVTISEPDSIKRSNLAPIARQPFV